MPAKPLTVEQLADAARLKALFIAWQQVRRGQKEPWSQEWASDQLGFGQSAMNQYLNGRIPLNPDAAVKFSKLLDRPVDDFSSAMAGEIARLSLGMQYLITEQGRNHQVQERKISYLDRQGGGAILIRLGAILGTMDATDRGMAALLLRDLAQTPERAVELGDKFERLLGELPAGEDHRREVVGR